ncbi:hypothetical protein JTB14_001157 [Gonioctena quinquepunctata]|nr:hypothetical protein JTB14_001157 [Gonioctena quinquepunctata]
MVTLDGHGTPDTTEGTRKDRKEDNGHPDTTETQVAWPGSNGRTQGTQRREKTENLNNPWMPNGRPRTSSGEPQMSGHQEHSRYTRKGNEIWQENGRL